MTQFIAATCQEVKPSWCKQMGFSPNRFFMKGDDEVFLVVSGAPIPETSPSTRRLSNT